MTPNDLPYLDLLQSAYSLLIIGLVFYLGTQGIAKKIRLLPIVKWIATYAYRSYLANVFVFQLVLKLVHPFLTNQPVSLVILVLYMGTFVGSFGLTVVIEHFSKAYLSWDALYLYRDMFLNRNHRPKSWESILNYHKNCYTL